MTTMEAPPKQKKSAASKPATEKKAPKSLLSQEQLEAIMDSYGLDRLLVSAYYAMSESVFKNRLIIGSFIALGISLVFNIVQYNHTPEPKVLHCTSDGRCVPIPTMDQPLYSDKEILSWSEQCVRDVYDLAYTNWTTRLQNNTGCLSDASRKSFVDSLKKIGVVDYLNTEYQGVLYATTQQSVLRQSTFDSEKGYYQWVVDVPYRLAIDGKRKGSMDLKMTMLIRRVGMYVRDKGIWTETYMVNPRDGGR